MTTFAPPAVVDRDGNLVLHARGGAVLTVDFTDAAGAARDVSALTLWFEIDGVCRVTCANGAANSQRIVTLTRAHVQAIGVNGKAAFSLVDETSTPIVLWAGFARVQGFATQPA